MAIGKNRELHKRFAKEFDSQGRYIVEKRTTMLRTVCLVTDKSWNGAYAIVDKDEAGVELVMLMYSEVACRMIAWAWGGR